MDNKLNVIRLFIPWRICFNRCQLIYARAQRKCFICPRPDTLVLCLSYLFLFGQFAWLSLLDPEFCMAFLIFPGVFPLLSYFFPAFCLSSLLVSLCFAPLVFSRRDVTPLLSQLVYFLSTCPILSLRDRDFNMYCAWNRFPVTDTWSTTIGLFILSWRMIVAVNYIDIAWLDIHWAVSFGTMLKFYTEVFADTPRSAGHVIRSLLDAFAKLRKATVTFVVAVPLSLCPPVRMEQLGSHWTDFHEIWYMSIFRKSVERIQVSLKSNNNYGYFT